VCRLSIYEGYKGVDTVLAALPKVIEKVPDLHYFVIAGGDDLERHRRLAISHGVADHVHFLGSVDDATLRTYYQACDIFVMPSAGEGFGIVFLESMKYAKPVIAANSGAVAEVVKDGVTGTLVEYGDVEQIANAIVEMANDPVRREARGRAGYARLMDNFTY